MNSKQYVNIKKLKYYKPELIDSSIQLEQNHYKQYVIDNFTQTEIKIFKYATILLQIKYT